MAGLRSAVLILATMPLLSSPFHDQEVIKWEMVDGWAKKLGVELWHCGGYVTRRDEMLQNYKEASVMERNGKALVLEIAREIKNMTDLKISAVKRIMDTVENSAMVHQTDNVTEYRYFNVKHLKTPDEPADPDCDEDLEMVLTPDAHFSGVPVNTSYSAVHVPTNVYGGAPDILRAIKWSSTLDQIFTNNYAADPSLSWQYFGSTTGFMRQYPAMKWKNDSVDMYDCRTRSWFIEAATSPKDVIVLVDTSGSMTGMRREIARHVVNNILDTLGNNDFVNVYNFSDEISRVVPCYEDNLVQANLLNIRELKQGMKDLYTEKIANFSAVLTKAFQILEEMRAERKGACCNQAIMLVTDGVPYNYKEIFEEYNWRDLPHMPVRVFTYLIGREVPDVREVRWMACANMGFYVHLSTLAEVREQVLQYIPVMARPMVLWRNEHPIVWTSVYADITDPKMTDWLWEEKESEEQRQRFLGFQSGRSVYEELDSKFVQKDIDDSSSELGRYQLMTSVSMPVFDRRENASKIANLLGVAGTDVPIQDIKKLLMPHRLGVGGYAFIVTNNGFILTHPDLRPVFQGILKPAYNAVDMVEVELVDEGTHDTRYESSPRYIAPEMLKLREAIVNQSTDSAVINVKYHYDHMRRVSTVRRHYFFTGIEGTPFTLVLTLPEPYGLFRVHKHEEPHLLRNQGYSVTKYFQGKNWKIHPDWTYCYYHYETEHPFDSPEDQLYHFLQRTQQPKWQWKSKRTVSPPEHASQCDRELFLSLVFDAKATEWFSKNLSTSSKDDSKQQFKQRFGITITFVATRSGLTRWQDMPEMEDKAREPHFSKTNNKAIDEVWYKRAVEQHEMEPESFVFSVPFNSGEKSDPLVTASNAIFVTSGAHSAPAAVVGFQFQHAALRTLFKNITHSCGVGNGCSKTCSSDDLDCFVLDNNGFVVVSEEPRHTGQFFGEVHSHVMEKLVEERVYQRTHVFDYQAVCFRGTDEDNAASLLMTPLRHLRWLAEWALASTMWALARTSALHLWLPDSAFASEDDHTYVDSPDEEEGEEEVEGEKDGLAKAARPTFPPMDKVKINRTRPDACDKEFNLYRLAPRRGDQQQSPYARPHNACSRPFVVQSIPHSNLVLVVVDSLCKADYEKLTISPSEVVYDNNTLSCYKVYGFNLHRTRPPSCINNHTRESEIKDQCGGSSAVHTSVLLLLPSWGFAYFVLS
ncbi:voltage-dependent calcium channel subunit alpha-2/delta-3 isoform X2 [Bacillus rossius redtenbacheri]|uniref:voltage-dependent calcium channel subunit alpha-2/delta-3 isoform X2 n=1 Tax=Bacillus rossius redtenbacheri TaxID=93214 RepID=UPI002FDC9B13